MAISSWCCLKPLPLLPISSESKYSFNSRTINLLRDERNDGNRSPQPSKAMMKTTTSSLLFKFACAAVIGLEIISPTVAAAMTSHLDESSWPGTAAAAVARVEVASNNTKAAGRWSEKRKCPPWNSNTTYETIVPENLPRPSAHRRSQKIGHGVGDSDDHVRSSESVNAESVIIKTKMGCFSM